MRKHGSPEDRGAADSWYGRPKRPHWFPNGSFNPPEIKEKDMTPEQIAAYHKGFDENEANPSMRKIFWD